MDRIEKIRRKFGVHAFSKWGSRGGNPALLKLKTGKYIIVKRG